MADMMTQLGLIFLASVVFMLFALRLQLPPVVGLLLAGAIIGPNMLGLVSRNEYITIFAEIGAILLLFFVGIEFSVSKMIKTGLRSLVVWLVKDAFIFILVYEFSLLLSLGELTAVVLASALTVSSTTFFIKLVSEKNISRSAEANMIFVVLIIEDLLAVFLLAIYSGMVSGGSVLDFSSIILSIFRAMLFITIAYLVLEKAIRFLFNHLTEYKSDEIMIFLSLSLAIMMSFFASSIGLAASIGAFLAGNMLSAVKGFRKTQDTLSKFGMLFSAFFFLSIGMLVSVEGMVQNILIILVLVVIVGGGTFGAVYISSYLLGYRSNSATRAGLLMLAVGEFSLLIAMQTRSLVAPFDIVSVTSALVFITALCGGILVRYDKEVDNLIGWLMPQKIKDSAKRVSLYLDEVLREFEPGGSVYTTFMKVWTKSVLSIVFVVLIAVSAVLSYSIIRSVFPAYADYVILVAAMFELIPLAHIAFAAKKFMDTTAGAFHKAMGKNLALDDLAMRDSAIVFFMFAIAVIIPLAVALLKLPSVFGMFFLVPLTISVLFVWNLAMTVRKIMFKKEIYRYEKKMAGFKPPYQHLVGEIRSINQPVYKRRGK